LTLRGHREHRLEAVSRPRDQLLPLARPSKNIGDGIREEIRSVAAHAYPAISSYDLRHTRARTLTPRERTSAVSRGCVFTGCSRERLSSSKGGPPKLAAQQLAEATA
jgi:hypothetical protein